MGPDPRHPRRSHRSFLAVALVVTVSLCAECQSVSQSVAAPSLKTAAGMQSGPGIIQNQGQAGTRDDGRYDVALGFFERLFGGHRRKKKEKEENAKKTKQTGPAAPAKPVIRTIQKDPDAAVIAVFGDEFSQDIAWGLQDAFSQTRDVKVEIHSLRRSGLVRRVRRNPLDDLQAVFEKSPFSFAVVMVGLNDRVKFPAKKNKEGEEVMGEIKFRAPGWDFAYEQQVDRIRAAFAEQEKSLFWVGLPPVSNKKLSNDLRFINDIVRNRLTGREERFIDIWDAFSNDEGEFAWRGPDLTGQDKRLRQKNGIRFNKAGRRKLAFFVEKLVIRALSQSVSEESLPDLLDSSDEVALKEGRGAGRGIFVVRKPPLDSNKLVKPALDDGRATGSARTVELLKKAPSLRVDDFSWTSEN